ncbi:trans-sulfuration enzyme family protein [Lacticaseibacillus daqingensis]|uniref:trans-sulfuration enzyme family protein n=1 Tax=Lacticaseibacillus daqingensis TaxID=2486014 RepID=UPI00384DDD29
MTKLVTQLIQGTNGTDDRNTGAVVPPLYFATAFRHPGLGASTGYDYARLETPTRALLEKQLNLLEGGAAALAVSSGMAAIDLVFSTFTQTGDHFIASDDLYGGSFRYFDRRQAQYHVNYDTWDGRDIAQLIQALRPETKLIWLESPSNPTMKLIDLEAVATAVHAVRPNILVAVDNTFLTPIYQRPLTLGADLVVHSATKYLGGHNDILAGAVVARTAALAEALQAQLTTTGQTLDPFSAWLLLRSLKTLKVRMAAHTENAQFLVAHLPHLTAITKLLYAGVGGMISFYLAPEVAVDAFLRGLKVCSFAESLGSVETLVTVPDVQTHHDMPEAQRRALGITPQLIRVSVGLEDAEDLLADLTQAIAGAQPKED